MEIIRLMRLWSNGEARQSCLCLNRDSEQGSLRFPYSPSDLGVVNAPVPERAFQRLKYLALTYKTKAEKAALPLISRTTAMIRITITVFDPDDQAGFLMVDKIHIGLRSNMSVPDNLVICPLTNITELHLRVEFTQSQRIADASIRSAIGAKVQCPYSASSTQSYS